MGASGGQGRGPRGYWRWGFRLFLPRGPEVLRGAAAAGPSSASPRPWPCSVGVRVQVLPEEALCVISEIEFKPLAHPVR